MFKIAICDDDVFTCTALSKILNQIENENVLAFEIKIFLSGEELYKHILEKDMKFDMIFLDIELPQMSGIDIGNIIRKEFKNEKTKIIFISNHVRYALELFQIRPFDFVIKPIKYDKIEQIIKTIMSIIYKQNGTFEYQVKNKKYEIELYKVLYFASEGRKIIIHTQKNNFPNNEFYGKISDISSRLLNLDFFLSSSYCLVNYYAVAEFSYKKVILINGDEIIISQAHQTNVRNMHMEKRGGNNDVTNSFS